jgi:hypothetical protein
MSDVKRLLEEATPLPWKPFADKRHPVEGRVGCVATAPNGATAVCYGTNGTDAALIVYAVNRLPDYEAAVEALERCLESWDYGDFDRADYEAGRAALARLREQVPA